MKVVIMLFFKPETLKPIVQHVHFSLTAQITKFRVPKRETWNPVCNMSIFHVHYTIHWVPSAEGRDPNPKTWKYHTGSFSRNKA